MAGHEQGRNAVWWRPGQVAKLAPPCSNLMSFGSKSAVAKSTCDILKTFWRLPLHSDSAPGELCPPRYASGHERDAEWMKVSGYKKEWKRKNSTYLMFHLTLTKKLAKPPDTAELRWKAILPVLDPTFGCFHLDCQQTDCLLKLYCSACQSGVSYTLGCTRIFQGCTNLMGCTGVYQMCALQEQSNCPHMSFAPAKCINFWDFKTVSTGGALSVFSWLFICDVGQMTITYSFFL